ncbi:MAG: hypothetical protein IAF38_10875 [Bacteroidia bacterium]|nr:hypothetical protein [Bacteroidia bacterium]
MRKIITTFVLFITFQNCFCTNNFSMTAKTDTTLTGKIVKEAFVNQRGKVSDKIFDMFLESKGKKYFIKFCEGKVLREKLEKIVGKEMQFRVEICEGEWDKCSEQEVQSRVGDYVKMLELKTVATGEKLSYADGSGNVYVIKKESIEYIPVKKENSSSGEYSGGEPLSKSITEEAWTKTKKEFDSLFKNKKIQIKNRMMGTGLLSITKKGKETIVLIAKSPEMENLEKSLKKLLGL